MSPRLTSSSDSVAVDPGTAWAASPASTFSSTAMPSDPCRSKNADCGLTTRDVPGEGVDAGQREALQPARVVGQPPLGQQARVRVDPDAQRPVRADRRRQPLPERCAWPRHDGSFLHVGAVLIGDSTRVRPHERAFRSAACMSCSDRTPIPPPSAASMPCTAAAAPCTVVMHGIPRATAAERIS